MTRIRFENAPSTKTPINADNLNKLNNVIISSSEPTTGEEVWLQKGKNLSEINSISKVNGEQNNYLVRVMVKENKEYTVSGIKTRISNVTISNNAIYTFAKISYYDNNNNLLSTLDGDVINYFAEGSITFNKTITIPESCNHITIDFSNNNGDTNMNTSVSNIMVEQGSTATSYEEYIDKKIYTKNDNGIYEEFSRINDISLIPLTINEDYVYSTDLDYICVKIGKLVFLNIRTIAFIQNLNHGDLLLTGLPKPSRNPIFYLYGGNASRGETVRCVITEEGKLQTHYGGTTSVGDSGNKQFGGTLIYETNE